MTASTKIWFNRGFSLAPIAKLMREADPMLDVYVSVSPHSAHYPGPTETWIDGGETDPEDSDAYVQWVRDTIAAHDIDIFIPTRRRKAIAAASLPCRTHLPASIETIELLDDKYAFAEALAGEAYHLPTYVISDSHDLEQLIVNWSDDAAEGSPCVKPRHGVNGLGFWRLMDVSPIAHLQDSERRRIRPDQYIAALREQERHGLVDDIVVMPYLPGPEISFDILADHGRTIKYAARTKLGTGRQHIVTRHPLGELVASIVERFSLHGLVNAQFRKAYDESWKLLEINARPAGGVVYADQVGCRLVADWAGLLTGRLTPETVDQSDINTEVAFSTVVRPVAA
jgi:hypothetical protein